MQYCHYYNDYITRNKLRISMCTEYEYNRKIEDGKGDVLTGDWTHDLALHFGKRLVLV